MVCYCGVSMSSYAVFIPLMLLSSLSLCFSSNAQTVKQSRTSFSPTVHMKQLKNGLRVFVQVDRRAPLVTHQVWYQIGSADEPAGLTGITHLLEHLMFNGTKKYPGDALSKEVARLGGDDNAFTSYDYTAYFQNIPAEHLGTMMELEADRMANLNITQREFDKELKVVREERRLRTTDNPQSRLFENFMAASFQNSGYHNPIIGWDEDLITLTKEDAISWYDQWYAPNNAIVVVAGDVNPDKVFALAKAKYGKVKAKPGVRRTMPKEPSFNYSVEVAMQEEKVAPQLVIGYKVPSYLMDKKESIALSLLSMALTQGESDWLVRKLVFEEKLALSVDAQYSLEDRGTTLFTVSATPTQGTSLTTLANRIKQLLAAIPDSLFTPALINKMSNQLKSSKVFSRDSLFYSAMLIGLPETVGISWKEYASLIDHARKVSPQALKHVANKYLSTTHTATGLLTPKQ